MADEWGPRIEHDGRGCPLPPGTYVWIKCVDGEEAEGIVCTTFTMPNVINVWDFDACMRGGNPDWVCSHYRIRKPRGLSVLENLMADLSIREDA